MDNIEDLVLTDLQRSLLESISNNRYFTDHFYFAGGSALSSYYFKHRQSENLDFFSESNFDHQQVLEWHKTLGDAFKTLEITKAAVTSPTTIVLTDPQSTQTLKLSFCFFPYKHLGNHCYLNSLRISSLEDIAIHKVKQIIAGARKRDYLDLMHCLTKLKWTDEEITRKFKTKFKTLLASEALLAGYKNIDESVEDQKVLGDHNWEEVKKFFLDRIV